MQNLILLNNFLLIFFSKLHYFNRPRLCYSDASVCRLSSSVVVVCTECIVAKRCALEQKLLLTAYRKSYTRNRLVLK